MDHQVDLAQYLFTRLAEIGVGSVHGVPGDYNLTALDYLEPAGLHWVGNANELNAGYAADGYARIKGIAALATSFGVGELSTINAIGAAYAEKAAVVHIVGTPPRASRNAGACLHHSLGDGNFRVFADMYKAVTVAQANLTDANTAAQLIDAALKECLLQSRPVYIEMPTDMVTAKVAPPASPLDLSIPGHDEAFEDRMVGEVLTRMLSAKRPLILVDGFTARFDIRDEVNELVAVTKFPTLTTPFGKSIVQETLPNFHGIFSGLAGDPAQQKWVQDCDLVLRFGPLDSDFNTFGFTAQPNPQVTITFERHSIQLRPTETSLPTSSPKPPSISTKSLLQKLLKQLSAPAIQLPTPHPFLASAAAAPQALPPPPPSSSPITHRAFWPRLSAFLRPADVLLTETGTCTYGGQTLGPLPPSTTLINSAIWLSIGYALAAAQGAALAQRDGDRRGRTIVFEGEGSFQMTAQAVSDVVRNRLDVVVFVVNNDGYAVERLIHGFGAGYNEVQPWRYGEAAGFFGAPVGEAGYPVRVRRAETWGELEEVLGEEGVGEGKGLVVVEVIMGVADAPEAFIKFAEYIERRNKGGV
ncbi:pyruvate decarboxylase [Diplodia corticola]|uniref:Pyruvate decarboxylase n=1 Tax=Diplodia corticola TaxID=236234 RepID=A0A1J9SIY4_9PEZI|nr:pyruvate decarboxylase [Diplodia corticola]OJD40319.1 pyruvate decarboxylase [Diplodia corticola]